MSFRTPFQVFDDGMPQSYRINRRLTLLLTTLRYPRESDQTYSEMLGLLLQQISKFVDDHIDHPDLSKIEALDEFCIQLPKLYLQPVDKAHVDIVKSLVTKMHEILCKRDIETAIWALEHLHTASQCENENKATEKSNDQSNDESNDQTTYTYTPETKESRVMNILQTIKTAIQFDHCEEDQEEPRKEFSQLSPSFQDAVKGLIQWLIAHPGVDITQREWSAVSEADLLDLERWFVQFANHSKTREFFNWKTQMPHMDAHLVQLFLAASRLLSTLHTKNELLNISLANLQQQNRRYKLQVENLKRENEFYEKLLHKK